MGKYELSLKDYDFRSSFHRNLYCHGVNKGNCDKCLAGGPSKTECVLVNNWRIHSENTNRYSK